MSRLFNSGPPKLTPLEIEPGSTSLAPNAQQSYSLTFERQGGFSIQTHDLQTGEIREVEPALGREVILLVEFMRDGVPCVQLLQFDQQ